jgi:hypothetical protein
MKHLGTFQGVRAARSAAWRENCHDFSSGAECLIGIALFFAVFVVSLGLLP